MGLLLLHSDPDGRIRLSGFLQNLQTSMRVEYDHPDQNAVLITLLLYTFLYFITQMTCYYIINRILMTHCFVF